MADPIESAEAFASRLSDLMCISHGDNFVWAGPNVAAAILARDAAVRREALAPFAWAIAEAFRCEKDIEIRVGSLTTVVTAADVRRALATGDSDG